MVVKGARLKAGVPKASMEALCSVLVTAVGNGARWRNVPKAPEAEQVFAFDTVAAKDVNMKGVGRAPKVEQIIAKLMVAENGARGSNPNHQSIKL